MSDIKSLFEKISGLTVLVVGDVMVDTYSFGKVSRISPEAPVPVVDIIKKENRLGGAANVAKNIKALGAKCILCSVIGKGDSGDEFLRLIEKNQIVGDGLVRSEERKTTVKHRVMSGSQQLIRLDEEDRDNIASEDNTKLLQNVEELMEKADVVVLQDYDKGIFTEKNIQFIVEKASKNEIPVVVDPKNKNFLYYKNIDLFKPNLKEINEGFGLHIQPKKEETLKKGVAKLREAMNIKNVLLTLSENGLFYDFEGEQKLIPTEAKRISDVSGAGDTVLSVAAVLRAADAPAEIIAKLSNLAGGIVCSKLGVVPIDKKELIEKAGELKF